MQKNEIFHIALRPLRGKNSFLDKIKLLGGFNLTDDDVKEFNSLHPGFSLKHLIDGQKSVIMLICGEETI